QHIRCRRRAQAMTAAPPATAQDGATMRRPSRVGNDDACTPVGPAVADPGYVFSIGRATAASVRAVKTAWAGCLRAAIDARLARPRSLDCCREGRQCRA